MDLLNKGCHLCEDWPCVKACEPKALQFPEVADEEKPIMPKFASAEINTEACLPYHGPECGACAPACPVPGALIWEMEKPHIDPETCTGCGLCREICVVNPKAITIHSLPQKQFDPDPDMAKSVDVT
jgi:ferredoxin-type protein NapG